MLESSFTRRRMLAFAAAPLLEAQDPSTLSLDAELVSRHDTALENLVRRQITDPASPDLGGLPDADGIFFAGSPAGIIESCVAAFICPQSRHHQSAELLNRIRLAAGWLEKNQLPSGNFDLPITNFNSPPDTAFLTQPLANAALLARLASLREVSPLIEPILRRISRALAVGGVHTPNHRWVVCEALAQLHELYGEARSLRRIEEWLAEGVDIDADGQFTERSTTIYDTVCDRAFTVLAHKLKRPELLEPVRRNFASLLLLLHADGEVVTEISTRQDANERATAGRYWFPLRYLAVKDNDSRFAALARRHEAQASLPMTMLYPELRQPLPPDAPLPADFSTVMPALRAARIRRGALSASVLWNDSDRFFTLRKGACIVQAVRFASAFFGKGQFRPQTGARQGESFLLEQRLEGPYYQPLDPPRKVAAGEYGGLRHLRRQSEICLLTQSARIQEKPKGFSVEIAAQGTGRVPVAVEISLRPGGILDGVSAHPRLTDCSLLKSGFATYRCGTDTVRFGPGLGAHTYVDVRGASPRLPGLSVYLCGFTPLRHTLEFETA